MVSFFYNFTCVMKYIFYILFYFVSYSVIAQTNYYSTYYKQVKYTDTTSDKNANSNKKYKQKRMWAAKLAYKMSGGKKKYNKRTTVKPKGEYYTNADTAKFFANNKNDTYGRYVNLSPQFLINEQMFKSERVMVNELLGNFINGKGPENVVFPHNGVYADKLKSSVMIKDVIKEWKNKSKVDDIYYWRINAKKELKVDFNSGPISLEHFIGSAAIKITTLSNNEILFEIFNVTSITSADINKVLFHKKPLYSVTRNNTNALSAKYANISQYFSFTMNIN